MDDQDPAAPTLAQSSITRAVKREYAHDRRSHFGRLDKALDAAPMNDWTVAA